MNFAGDLLHWVLAWCDDLHGSQASDLGSRSLLMKMSHAHPLDYLSHEEAVTDDAGDDNLNLLSGCQVLFWQHQSGHHVAARLNQLQHYPCVTCHHSLQCQSQSTIPEIIMPTYKLELQVLRQLESSYTSTWPAQPTAAATDLHIIVCSCFQGFWNRLQDLDVLVNCSQKMIWTDTVSNRMRSRVLMQNQPARELISTRKTSHKRNSKDLSHLQ